jgi:hypothetical protein
MLLNTGLADSENDRYCDATAFHTACPSLVKSGQLDNWETHKTFPTLRGSNAMQGS